MNTTQNQVTDALTEAIKTIADSSVQSKDATLTIEAEIVDVIDEGLGTYTVKYLGNKFEATTAHTEVTYQIGDIVYVVVPNGNFDKNKIILSPAAPSVAGYAASSSSNGSIYINMGDNLFNRVNDISLCSWRPTEGTLSVDTKGFCSLFKGALQDSRTFNFTCKIRTDIDKERRSKGNYGLELYLPVIQNINGQSVRKDYVVTLDVNNITGDPYNLQSFALQNIYFTFPEDMDIFIWTPPEGYWNPQPPATDVPRIRYFVKDFLGEDITGTKPDDIFITDIQVLPAIEIKEENMPGYNIIIRASGGNSFLTGRSDDVKTLSVLTFLNGKQTKNDAFDCYWFKENVGINSIDNDKYHRLGGIGWEILNNVKETTYLEDGKPIYQYVTNDYTQKILQTDIHYDTVFKCVLAKDINTEKPIIRSATITIKNLQNNATISLKTENGSTSFANGIGSVVLQLDYYEDTITNVVQSDYNVGYYWQKTDKFGNIINNFTYEIKELNKQINGAYRTKIKCPISDIDEVSIFKCTVYIEVNKQRLIVNQIIGTVSLMITAGQLSNGHIEVINDNKLYKYDADGNSPTSLGQYSGALSDYITTIDPIEIKLYKSDGTEFTYEEYAVTDISWLVPINSMIALTSAQQEDTTSNPGYYTITGKYPYNNKLDYRIATSYNYNKVDNTIIIKASSVSSVLKDTLSTIARLTFLKDGEGGTNGTSYSAVVKYNNYSYGENNHKFQLIYAADVQKWYIFDPGKETDCYSPFPNDPSSYNDYVSFSVSCYLQGEPVSSQTTKWSIFDSGHEKNSSYISATSPLKLSDRYTNGCFVLSGNNMSGPEDVFCTIIQAEVTCTSSQQGAPTIIYAYYPVECTYIAYESYLENFILYLKDGFSKVLYKSDGSNPQYDQKSSFLLAGYYYSDLSDYFYGQWKNSPNITVTNTTLLENKVKPTSKFDNGVSNNYVQLIIKSSQERVTKITQKLTDLNRNKTDLEKLIEYYQTLQSNLSVFSDFYNYYSYYEDLLKETTSFYSIKTNLTDTIKDLMDKAKQIQTITEQYKKKDNGSTDINVNNIYNIIRNRIGTLNILSDLCSQLGVNDVITQINDITPESLLVTKISYTGLPERDCYYSINNFIDSYNYIVNNIYSNCLNSLNKSRIISQERTAKRIMAWLTQFSDDIRLDNLTKSYNGYKIECYRYTGLLKAIEGRVNSASDQTDTYSYNLILNNILRPIYNDLVWYISFTNGGGYNSTIEDLNTQLDKLLVEINLLTTYKDIATEMYLYNRSTISCCRPIVMTYNRYEMSFLNGWDGNKLQTADGYIIAPQVGAGIKNSDNSFTGIVLGTKQVKERANGQIGLFGYNYGIQTMFLNSRNGSASFGETGAGQIILDPSDKKAIIKSGNYNNSNSNEIFVRVYQNVDYSSNSNPSELAYWEYVLNNDSSAYIYVETTDTRPIANKAYYKKTDIKGGMLIDLTTPEIKFGTGNFSVTKEGHITAKGGGTIAGWEIDDNNLYSKATNQNKITIHSGDGTGHWEESVYIYDYPCIFSGTHNKIDSSTTGFYLGPNGLSICNSTRSRLELSTSGDPKIFSGNHNELSSTTKGFYLGQDGFSICNGTSSRFEISTDGNPKLFSNSHNELSSTRNGFYLGNDGLSIGSKVYIDNSGTLRLGNGAVADSGKHWTISGNYYDSYIAYGTQGSSGSVYIGTDKISLGEDFFVRNDGYLEAKNALIKGTVQAEHGSIGGWTITQTSLTNGNVSINSSANAAIVGPNGYIDLEGEIGSDGTDFRGCHISANNVCFSAGKIWTTRQRGATTLYEGKDCHYKIKTGYKDNYLRLRFINGLLVEHETYGDWSGGGEG